MDELLCLSHIQSFSTIPLLKQKDIHEKAVSVSITCHAHVPTEFALFAGQTDGVCLLVTGALKVNISSAKREDIGVQIIAERRHGINPAMFNSAQDEIFNLMAQDSYQRFTKLQKSENKQIKPI
eukprot:325557_1